MFNPFTALTSKIFGATTLALLMVTGLLSCRLEGVTDQRDEARQLARDTKAAFDKTVADYRAAAAKAARIQAANLARAKAEQERINDETLASYDARLADARRRLVRAKAAAADPGRAGEAGVPGAGASAGGADEATGNFLSAPRLTNGERLIAAEQAIQLDELINWNLRQAQVATSPAE